MAGRDGDTFLQRLICLFVCLPGFMLLSSSFLRPWLIARYPYGTCLVLGWRDRHIIVIVVFISVRVSDE